jgi:thiamine-phosphate pyrophosphorylase
VHAVRGLYAIVDTTVCRRAGVDPIAIVEASLAARPAALQIRAKDEGARRTLELLRAAAPRCRAAGVPLFANDRPDLAILAGCDGVHVGQGDLAPADVRALAERAGRADLRVGTSTHDEAELAQALGAPVDVIAIGPVLGTTTKANPEPTVGLERALRLARAARAARPEIVRVAIGGIDAPTAAAFAVEFDQIAVIGALLPPGATGSAAVGAARERAARLGAAFAGAMATLAAAPGRSP